MDRKWHVLLWLLTLAFSAALIAELWARARFADAPPLPSSTPLTLPHELVQKDTLLGYHFVPNASKFFESPYKEFKVNYQINEIGLRDSGMLASGTKQPIVLTLGDSAVEGWGVMPEATFLLEMQRRLRFQNNAEIFPRLLNAGMTGFGAAQSYLLGKKLIDEIKPKMIVFAYSSLMPVADYRFLQHAIVDSTGLAKQAGSDFPSAVGKANDDSGWLSNFMLIRLLKERMEASDARKRIEPGNPATDIFAATRGSSENMENLHAASLNHVRALAKLAHEKNIKFMLLHMPLPHQVAEDEWLEGRSAHRLEHRIYETPDVLLLNELCVDENIECAMPRDMFRKLAKERSSRIFYRHDYAFTEVGHNALIDFLIAKIRDSLDIAPPTK